MVIRVDPKTSFFGWADGSYIYSLCSHSNNFYIKYVFKINWRPGITTPNLAAFWRLPGFICVSYHTVFTPAFCLPPPVYQVLSHLRIHRHILNKKFPFLFCVCVFCFQHRPKRERRGKHRGKRSSQTKLAGRLHLRRYVFWSSASPSFRVERGSTFLTTHTL